MTAVAPRPVAPSSASAGPVPGAAARPAERSEGTGGRDFEAVLRGRGGKDPVTPRPSPKDRDAHAAARRSPSDHADRTGQRSSTTVAASADPARPAPDPAAPGVADPGASAGAPTTTPVTLDALAPAVGTTVPPDAGPQGATVQGATVLPPADPTSSTPAPVVPGATSAPVVPGAAHATAVPDGPATAGQAAAVSDRPAAGTTPAQAGGAIAGATADALVDAPGRPPAAPPVVGVPGDGSGAAVVTPVVTALAVTAAAGTASGIHLPTTLHAGAAAPEQATGDANAGPAAYAMGTVATPPTGAVPTAAAAGDTRPAQPALPPQAQVLNAVSPLLTTADGTHRLTVHLAPAHLGSVQVHLEVRGGEVTVRLTAVDPATGDALRQGAPELRSHLERIGLRSAGIDVQVAPGDPARDPAGGTTTGDRGSRGQDQHDQDQRDPAAWTGGDGAGRGGDASRDGAWQRHGRPLEGWTPRADGARPDRGAPGEPDQLDPPRPRPRDVRVDVRM